MGGKRFTMDLDGFFYDNHRKKNSANIYDNNTFIGSVIIGAKFIIDLLNELDEKYVDEFALRETLQQELQIVENENEQLKKELDKIKVVNEMLSMDFANSEHELSKENEELKQSNERIIKDIDLALGFIRHKGYSLQDIKDYEDAKKEYEEDLANYRKGDVE